MIILFNVILVKFKREKKHVYRQTNTLSLHVDGGFLPYVIVNAELCTMRERTKLKWSRLI